MDPEPTEAMVEFYERRTAEHIARVRRCLLALAVADAQHADALRERAALHDASKFGPEERAPYIWLTEYYRCRNAGAPFAYPPGVRQQVSAAIRHHLATNRHHPEFHADPNDMTDVDLIEMVCDWTAMAQEFDEGGGSARAWADATIGAKLHLSDERRRFVYATIDALDAARSGGG